MLPLCCRWVFALIGDMWLKNYKGDAKYGEHKTLRDLLGASSLSFPDISESINITVSVAGALRALSSNATISGRRFYAFMARRYFPRATGINWGGIAIPVGCEAIPKPTTELKLHLCCRRLIYASSVVTFNISLCIQQHKCSASI